MNAIRTSSKATSLHGVGLVEILIGILVVGVLVAAAIPSMTGFLERRRVIATANELTGILAYAKAETNVIGTGVTVNLQDDPTGQMSCAAVGTASMMGFCRCYNAPSQVCSGGSALLRLFQLPRSNGVRFQASATTWGANQVVTFSRDSHAQLERDVKITVTGQRTGAQLRININDARMVSTCSPNGGIKGYPVCS
jgi:type IV fimbrial biogenesis protein FimT